ncbi:hypothetical protein ACIBL6_23790 [Streptomyces sp. NPDC050400]|uniref:hypothetical protein n=1 Tax=Streptomyces sp. NPDC050400 TaxID=3365610 RepID=UPI0037BD6A62
MSDEEWERFLRESAEGVRDAPKEPSARARMVTRRLREEQGPPEGWRSHRPAAPRRRRIWPVLGVLAAVALVVVALDPGRVTGWFGGGGEDAAPLAAESARPTGPPPEAAGRPTLDEPFKGSPAARWGDGAAGIGMPSARATGWMSKAQVARTLERSRDFLVASSLDPGVLRGGRPAKAIAYLNPHQSDVRTFLTTSLTSPSRKNNPLLLFSRFDRTKARLVGDVIKTRGRVTYEEGESGAVEVHTDVTYVYPVTRPERDSTEVARTIVRREVVMSWDDPAKIVTEPGTFSAVSYSVDTTNGGCDTSGGYLVPEFGSERQPGDGPSVDPYDRSTTMDQRMNESDGKRCGAATRG